jgi:hypothetical protein
MDEGRGIFHRLDVWFISASAPCLVSHKGGVDVLQDPCLRHHWADLLSSDRVKEPLHDVPHAVEDETTGVDDDAVQPLREVILQSVVSGERQRESKRERGTWKMAAKLLHNSIS